jgi:hypothetical protein
VRHPRTLIAALTAVVLVGVATLQAAQISSGDLESVLRRHGLDRRESAEILQAHRGAVNVGIQPKRVEAIIAQALDGDMEAKQLVRCLTLATDAVLNGLPPGPMLNKLSEGLAKHADPDDIVGALEKRAMSLVDARRLLGDLIYEDKPLGGFETVLVAVAGALERGVKEGEVRQVLRREGATLRELVLEIERLD